MTPKVAYDQPVVQNYEPKLQAADQPILELKNINVKYKGAKKIVNIVGESLKNRVLESI